jgi:hypothetical protein
MDMKLVGSAGGVTFMSWVSSTPADIVTVYDNLGPRLLGGIGLTDDPSQSFRTGKYAESG